MFSLANFVCAAIMLHDNRIMEMPQLSSQKAASIAAGKNRYAGKTCNKHPEDKGERYTASGECCACAIAKVTAYRTTPRGRKNVLENSRRRKYGIEPAQFDALLALQNGCCAICKTPKPGGRDETWHLDHNHTTKQIRGILCARCNVGLGHFGDSAELLFEAHRYLAITP